MIALKKSGFILVMSAPSGGGKTSIAKGVLQRNGNIISSISVTTRPKRPSEKHGRDYFFVSEEEFKRKVEEDEFAEWALVHGAYYGTLSRTLNQAFENGKIIILCIDIQGAVQIREKFPEQSVLIFVLPPSTEVLEERLRKRGTDTEETIKKRLEAAREEIAQINRYDYVVVNNDLEMSIKQVESIIEAESCRIRRVVPSEQKQHFARI